MTTATLNGSAKTTKAIKGFSVACPLCGSDDEGVKMDLNSLGDCECGSCGESFTVKQAVAKAAEVLKRWEKVATWVALASEIE